MKIALILCLILSSCSGFNRTPSSINSILYIGDSQSEGYLGGMVFEHLDKISKVKKINLYGVGSSSPRHWGDKRSSKNSKWLCKRKGRKNSSSRVPMKGEICLSTNGESAFGYLNRDKPGLVIFQFLGNSMGFNQNYISEKVGNLLGALTDEQQCLFITSPPYYKDLVEKNKLRVETQEFFIGAIGSRCKVVKGVTKESLQTYAHDRDNYLGDRIHLSKKGASEFFKMILPELP